MRRAPQPPARNPRVDSLDPPLYRPRDRGDRDQPVLAVLPGVDAQDAGRAVSIRREIQVQYFSIGYYIAADVGCLSIGFLTKWLAGRGCPVHGARLTTFFGVLTADRSQCRGCGLAGLVAAAGDAAGHRVRLAGPVPQLLRVHPGALGAADGKHHRCAELPDVDGPRARAGADRPLDRPRPTGMAR